MRSHASCNSKNMLGRCKMVTQIGMKKKIKAGKSTPDHFIYSFRSILLNMLNFYFWVFFVESQNNIRDKFFFSKNILNKSSKKGEI